MQAVWADSGPSLQVRHPKSMFQERTSTQRKKESAGRSLRFNVVQSNAC